ncbi:glycosyltransferase family 2 protein [Roseomonas sp. NAR14]|uniref:Glycosyltransferase family 2 protein n=2 Tax=Roseomonas acroporae TaxID=2937791 RepID=A0A9X1YFC0_9PROT|nr:glycosyltransferase family 2 protein [Roseomonas acroporae]
MSGDDVLIVIPALNEEAHIAGVVAAMQADAAMAGALIVVSDGGSRDRTVEIVRGIGMRDPRVRVAVPERPDSLGTPSANVNRAVRQFGAGRRWLVRVDAHAAYPPAYASRLVAAALRTGADCVVTPMLTRGRNCFSRAAAAAQNSLLGTGGSAHRLAGRGGWVDHGHHALMRLDAFRDAGGYDEAFSHNEDAELDLRLAKAGNRIWLADDVMLTYYPRGTARGLWRQYFKYGKGRAMTVSRHGGSRKLRQTIPLLIAPMLLVGALAPLPWLAGMPLLAALLALPSLGYVALCLLYGAWLGRHGDGCAALAGVPAMIMHVAWSAGYWRQVLAGPSPGAFTQPAIAA